MVTASDAYASGAGWTSRPVACQDVPGPVDIEPAVGEVLHLSRPTLISTVEDGEPTSRPVLFQPQLNGTELTIELPDLHLRLEPVRSDAVALCEAGPPAPDEG